MRKNISVYCETLQELTKHIIKLEISVFNDNDFIDFQNLESKIIDRYKAKYYNDSQYRALNAIAAQIHADYRNALKLNQY